LLLWECPNTVVTVAFIWVGKGKREEGEEYFELRR
jgi:hypothetical protein